MIISSFWIHLVITNVCFGFDYEDIEVPVELENAIRCLIRTWIRRELPKRMNIKVRFPTEADLPPERRLPSCTADLLARAGLPQDIYYVGGNRIWDAVSGWLERTIEYDQFNETMFPSQNDSNVFLDNEQTDNITLNKLLDRKCTETTTIKGPGHELDYKMLITSYASIFHRIKTYEYIEQKLGIVDRYALGQI